jgi:hypothetical protein
VSAARRGAAERLSAYGASGAAVEELNGGGGGGSDFEGLEG